MDQDRLVTSTTPAEALEVPGLHTLVMAWPQVIPFLTERRLALQRTAIRRQRIVSIALAELLESTVVRYTRKMAQS